MYAIFMLVAWLDVLWIVHHIKIALTLLQRETRHFRAEGLIITQQIAPFSIEWMVDEDEMQSLDQTNSKEKEYNVNGTVMLKSVLVKVIPLLKFEADFSTAVGTYSLIYNAFALMNGLVDVYSIYLYQ